MAKSWQEFETYIATLYENLGFSTEHDVIIMGSQVDIVAEKYLPAIGKSRLAIECKYGDEDRTITNTEVKEFLAFAETARTHSHITHGVLITNGRFSRFAKEAAAASNAITLMDIDQLENQLFQFRDSYLEYTNDYEHDRIFNYYVPLSGRRSASFDTAPIAAVEDVESSLINWFNSSDIGFVSILGDFGAGKTTLLQRLKYDYAKMIISGQETYKPILFLLKEYYKYSELDSLITRTLNREFKREIPLSLFWRAAREGQFILLLDGFDEMLPQADRKARAHQFALLSPLFTIKSKVVLTCRPAYFITEKEYKKAVTSLRRLHAPIKPHKKLSKSATYRKKAETFQSLKNHLSTVFLEGQPIRPLAYSEAITIELDAFSNEKINQFLEANNSRFLDLTAGKHDWSEVRIFLDSIYDLSDLMRRPILLDMITETVVSGAIDISNRDLYLGPTALYELNTDMQFDRDWRKGEVRQAFLSKEQRRLFAKAIALAMFKNSSLEVSYEDILQIVEEHGFVLRELKKTLQSVSPEEVASDIRVCSFLSRGRDGMFRFAHKSFMEYFVARYLKDVLSATNSPELFSTPLPKEMLYFLGGYGFMEPNVLQMLIQLQKKGTPPTPDRECFMKNLCSAILFSSREHEGLRLKKGAVWPIEIRHSSFTSCTLSEFKFEETTLEDVSITSSFLRRVRFDNCQLVNLMIEKTESDVAMRKCEADGIELRGGQFNVVGQGFRANNVSAIDGNIAIRGNVDLVGITAKNSTIEITLTGGSAINGSAELSRFVISAEPTDLRNIDFVDCDLSLSRGGKISKCTLQKGVIKLNNGGSPAMLRHCELNGTRISCGSSEGETKNGSTVNTAQSLRCTHCEMKIYSDFGMTGCDIANSTVHLRTSGTARLWIHDSKIRQTSIVCSIKKRNREENVDIRDVEFRESVILGMQVSGAAFSALLKMGDRPTFRRCNGVVLVLRSGAWDQRTPEMKPVIAQQDGLFFVDREMFWENEKVITYLRNNLKKELLADFEQYISGTFRRF